MIMTADSKFILAGLSSGQLLAYDTVSGERISKYEGHSHEVTLILFSPTHVFFISASDSLTFWGPNILN